CSARRSWKAGYRHPTPSFKLPRRGHFIAAPSAKKRSSFKKTPPQTSIFSRPFGARQTVTRSLSAHLLDQAAWRSGQPGPHLVQSRDEGSDASSLCNGDGVRRRRSVPRGTVG